MRVRVGTSGYSYKEWKGVFYPEDLAASEMLRYYAERHDTVEINNTFYRMPSRKMLDGWREQVPGDFAFVLKASRRITHQKRLKDVGGELEYLLGNTSRLGGNLGPFLFQLPPWLKKDVERLRSFLGLLPGGTRAALEFRSSSWADDEVSDLLREHDVARVVSDTGKDGERPVDPTAGFGYLRLRSPSYDDAELRSWAARIHEQPWDEAFVFFKHEDDGAGPELAARFRTILAV
jgi:uncharacterized protein YecE (DUF72 family)